MVTNVSKECSASVFRIKQIEECHLKLCPPKIFVVVLYLSWTVVSGLESGMTIETSEPDAM